MREDPLASEEQGVMEGRRERIGGMRGGRERERERGVLVGADSVAD